MPCFTAMRAEIALMSGSAFAVTHHAFSSGAGRTSDGNGSHASTLKSPSYTKSVSWQHYLFIGGYFGKNAFSEYQPAVNRRKGSELFGN
ncbi:putative IS1 encoded protein [Shigella dysenteriae 225-75]|nr:putative IS1 encoded protein [Shigella dysenteriae 225-75]